MKKFNLDIKMRVDATRRRHGHPCYSALLPLFLVAMGAVGASAGKVTREADDSPARLRLKTALRFDEGDRWKADDDVNNWRSKVSHGRDLIKTFHVEEPTDDEPWKNLRLPRNVLPWQYAVVIYPDFYGVGSTFSGDETVELRVTSPTKYFLLHVDTDYLNVTSARVVDNATGSGLEIQRQFYYQPNQFFVLEMTAQVAKAVRIVLSFQGSLTKSLNGLYKSAYINTANNETNYLVSTQFEPTYARRAFPCLDEPNMKAQFTVTLIHRQEYTALSNMPVDETIIQTRWGEDLIATKFQRSSAMSTYLVCMIVCNFEYIGATTNRGIPIRVFTSPDKIEQAEYALEMAKHSLEKYEEVFNIPYPLPKQDLIGIPDFASGAMENWGLITFRESLLLYDPEKTPLSSKERISSVVCHEMAHQWFGNFVTMDWWNDLWLNEGFATYMEYLCVASKEPSWDYVDEFMTDDTLVAMVDDALNSTHPIVAPVENPDEISSVFDSISYSKGASVIRMLETMMGEHKFFTGISSYLVKFAYGNAKTDDLWECLTMTDPGFDVKEVMDSWTLQGGFPYVNLTLVTSPPDNTTVTVTQKRFTSDGSGAKSDSKWYIDLDYIATFGVNGSKVLGQAKDMQFNGSFGLSQGNINWLKFNRQKSGFYRVLYPKDMWHRFTDYLVSVSPYDWTLSTADRADLLADAFSLAESGFLSYDVALTLSIYLSSENQLVPWNVAINYGMSYISDQLVHSSDYELWKKYALHQVTPIIGSLGFQDTGTHVQRRLRSLVLNQGCHYEDDSTVKQLGAMFRSWLDKGLSPSVNLRPAVYACGMAHFGTDADWNNVWTKYQKESSPQEKESLIRALSQTREPYLISELLDRARRVDGIKTQDFFTVVSNVGTNVYGNRLAWDWARENYTQFVKRFSLNDRNFGKMYYGLVNKFNSEEQLTEVKEFFAKYPDEGASARYRKMAIEDIEKNIKWMATARNDVVKWLSKRS